MIWPVLDWGWALRAFFAHFGLGFLVAMLVHRTMALLTIPKEFRPEFGRSLYVGFIGAICSVAIDLDHVVLFFGMKYGRPWHLAVAYLSALVITACVFYGIFAGNGRVEKSFAKEKAIAIGVWALCLIVHVYEDFTFCLF